MKYKTKKQVCRENKSIGYYSGRGGIEIKKIEYDIEDYVYYISNAWYPSRGIGYHKVKVRYDKEGDPYFNHYGHKISFNDILRMDV